MSGSPYVIASGDVEIPASASLTIEPGVTVYFAGHYGILGHGFLLALGNITDSIRFTTDTIANPAGWRGLTFLAGSGDTSRLAYCVFEYGRAEGMLWYDSCGGAFRNVGGRVSASHSRFHHNSATLAGGAVYASAATMVLDSCEFAENHARRTGGAAYVNASSFLLVSGCIFISNSALELGGGFMLYFGDAVIEHSLFCRNYCASVGGALSLTGMTGALHHCVVDSNIAEGGAAGLYIADSSTALTVDSCLIQNNTASVSAGGIYCWESAPVFNDCQILNNSSGTRGGGVNSYRWGAAPVFNRCLIRGNRCSSAGGGVWCATFATVILTNSQICDNWAAGSGGGLWSENSAAVFLDSCRIDSNITDRNGGGVACRISSLSMVGCSLKGNRADSSGGAVWISSCTVTADSLLVDSNEASLSGGGLYISDSSPVLSRLTVTGNTAGVSGGGIQFEDAPSPNLTRGRLISNHATDGGGISCHMSGVSATNCLFADNSATRNGGGLFLDSCQTVSLLHCTVVRNRADSTGGNLSCSVSSPLVKNSVLAYSAPNGVCAQGAVAPEIAFCCIYQSDLEGEIPAGFGELVGTNANGDSCDALINIFFDPLFVDTGAGDWHLRSDSLTFSPAIGAAGPGGPSIDLDGNGRPAPTGSLPDIGAFESPSGHYGGGLFGSLSGLLGPGFLRVVGDLSVAAGDTLVISPGTTLQFVGPYRFEVRGNLQAVGNESAPITLTCDTVITPNRWRGLRFLGATSSSGVLEFVVIEHALALGSGGGLFCGENSGPMFRQCTIRRNLSPYYGGGAAIMNASPTFDSCSVEFNRCNLIGGGLYFGTGSAATLTDCDISGNGSDSLAGGIACMNDAAPQIASCRIFENAAEDFGGGIYCRASRAEICKCVIARNTGVLSGGGAYLSLDTARIIRCTIVENTAGSGGGIHISGGIPGVNSSIVAFNSSGLYLESAASALISHCLLDSNGVSDLTFPGGNPLNGPEGIGIVDSSNLNGDPSDRYRNVFLDPQLVNRSEADYRVRPSSPAVDGGDPTLARDCDSTIADIGAFTILQDLTATPRAVHFGDVAMGDTLEREFVVHNRSLTAITLLSSQVSLPEFTLLTELENTLIAPGDSLLATVQFSPDSEQSYAGDLVITSDASINDTLNVRLFANGGIIPAPVKDLTVRIVGTDAWLRWSSVDTTIYGNPLFVDAYLIFESATSDGPLLFVAETADTSHVIPGAVLQSDRTFYLVIVSTASRSGFLHEPRRQLGTESLPAQTPRARYP